MAPTAGILVLVDDRALHPAIDRVVAAAGLKVVRASAPSSRRVWAGAAAILLDGDAALRCVQLGMPRRARVLLVCSEQPGSSEWQAAVAVGAQQLVILPTQERDLLSALTEAADAAGDGVTRGPVAMVEPFRDWNADGHRRDRIIGNAYFAAFTSDLPAHGLTVEYATADLPTKLAMGVGFVLARRTDAAAA